MTTPDSPSKNTRSCTQAWGESPLLVPVLVSPTKARGRRNGERSSTRFNRSLFRLSDRCEVRSHSRRRGPEILGKPPHNTASTCLNGTGFSVGTRFDYFVLLLLFTLILMLIFIASSVDAERAFSGGRLQVNHLQHQLSSQSFKAQVAVGSQQSSRKRCPKGRSVRSSQLRLRRTSILQW